MYLSYLGGSDEQLIQLMNFFWVRKKVNLSVYTHDDIKTNATRCQLLFDAVFPTKKKNKL